MNEIYCNNCGKPGHIYNQCKIPITSYGIITFRYNLQNELEVLMICRKDTLGYIDFIRGKYNVQNENYILNMLKQMTTSEKESLQTQDFDTLWNKVWGNHDGFSKGTMLKNTFRPNEEHSNIHRYKSEEIISKEKFTILKNGLFIKNKMVDLNSLIEESKKYTQWSEPEWGFPKGRRNYQEKDYSCALREFYEETGYSPHLLKNIQNIFPFEEIFTGSNYKSYKHKYYLAYMKYDKTIAMDRFQSSEVSKMEWKTYSECINAIRPYNLEKIRLLTIINNILKTFRIFLL
jgi:8-oxo-dGTP pyrophosphatase MutT (NUDIX family)